MVGPHVEAILRLAGRSEPEHYHHCGEVASESACQLHRSLDGAPIRVAFISAGGAAHRGIGLAQDRDRDVALG